MLNRGREKEKNNPFHEGERNDWGKLAGKKRSVIRGSTEKKGGKKKGLKEMPPYQTRIVCEVVDEPEDMIFKEPIHAESKKKKGWGGGIKRLPETKRNGGRGDQAPSNGQRLLEKKGQASDLGKELGGKEKARYRTRAGKGLKKKTADWREKEESAVPQQSLLKGKREECQIRGALIGKTPIAWGKGEKLKKKNQGGGQFFNREKTVSDRLA